MTASELPIGGDNGDTQPDLLPTDDRDKAIRELAETLKPIPFEGGTSASDEAKSRSSPLSLQITTSQRMMGRASYRAPASNVVIGTSRRLSRRQNLSSGSLVSAAHYCDP